MVPSVEDDASNRFSLLLLNARATTASSGQWPSLVIGNSPRRTSQDRIFPSEHPQANNELSSLKVRHRTRHDASLETSFRGQGGSCRCKFFHQEAFKVCRALRQSNKHELYVVRSKKGAMCSTRISNGTWFHRKSWLLSASERHFFVSTVSLLLLLPLRFSSVNSDNPSSRCGIIFVSSSRVQRFFIADGVDRRSYFLNLLLDYCNASTIDAKIFRLTSSFMNLTMLFSITINLILFRGHFLAFCFLGLDVRRRFGFCATNLKFRLESFDWARHANKNSSRRSCCEYES